MTRVITYGTFDLLHEGHVNILRRARELGDYLIVGVTSDEYDRYRGKLNVRQTLAERISAVHNTGFADKIIIEDYEGQKIEDIEKYDIDILTLGSDWSGKLDYIRRYCEVRYLPRTENISSTLLRTKGEIFNLGIVCHDPLQEETIDEIKYVSGVDINCLYAENDLSDQVCEKRSILPFRERAAFLEHCDIVYIDSCAPGIYGLLEAMIAAGKHVFASHGCGLSSDELQRLHDQARGNGTLLLLVAPLHSLTAYKKLINIVRSGSIGSVMGVDLSMTCGATRGLDVTRCLAPICLLPITHLLGTKIETQTSGVYRGPASRLLARCDIEFGGCYASLKVSHDVPTEGRIVIVGEDAYIKVPSPWWTMDYFEVRYRDGKIKKFSWPMSGRPIRYQLADFVKAINEKTNFHTVMEEAIALTGIAQKLFA